MESIINWIKEHQIISFLVLTFAITWGLGFTFDDTLSGGQDFINPFLSFLAICGPALAGILITFLIQPKKSEKRRGSFWIAFPVMVILTTAVFVVYNLIINQTQYPPLAYLILAVLSIPGAFVLSNAWSRVDSVRVYLSSLLKLKEIWVWLILAPFFMLFLDVLSILVSNALGRQLVTFSQVRPTGLAFFPAIGITFLYQVFFFNLTGEEIGWRGFALPRLLRRMSPIFAAVVLTFVWAFWHTFYWKAMGDPVLEWKYWLDTLIRLFPATILINWFYIRSKGSILVAGVMHAAANTFFTFMPRVDWPVHNVILYIVALVLILIDQGWQKLPREHPACQFDLLEAN